SSLFGKGDVNVFERVLEPVIAHTGKNAIHENRTSGHETEKAVETAATSKTTEHVAEHSAEEVSTERMLAVLSVLLALGGIGIGIALFKSHPLRRMPKLLADKWRIDELYNGYIVDPITNLSRNGLWKGFDLGFSDGIA